MYMYIYHCFRSYDWEETLVFTVIGLYRPIYGPCIHQCIFFACTFVNLPESVKIFMGNSLVITECALVYDRLRSRIVQHLLTARASCVDQFIVQMAGLYALVSRHLIICTASFEH